MRTAIITNYIPDYRYPVFSRLLELQNHEFLFLTSSPLSSSCAQAQRNLTIQHASSLTFPLRTRHKNSKTTQREQLPIPFALLKQLFAFKPDIIIAGDMGLRSLLCLITAKLLRAKFVIWSEEIASSAMGRSRLQHYLRGFLVKRTHAFLAWGKPSRDYLLMLGVADQHIYRCQQAVDNSFWVPLANSLNRMELRNEFDFHGKVFLLVGRLVERKGFHNFIKAWHRAGMQQTTAARAVIVGSGEQLDELTALAHTLALSNITFVPAQSPQQLAKYYAAADVFVFPSLEDVWGMVVNEALCFGLHTLASKYAGASLGLIDGSPMGTLFDPADITDFARQLTALATSVTPPDCKLGQSQLADVTLENCAQAIASMLTDLQRH